MCGTVGRYRTDRGDRDAGHRTRDPAHRGHPLMAAPLLTTTTQSVTTTTERTQQQTIPLTPRCGLWALVGAVSTELRG